MFRGGGESSGYRRSDPYGDCPRCGWTRRLSAFKTEWTGSRVCEDCYDPRPADTLPPHVGPEGVPRPDAMPEIPGVDRVPPIPPIPVAALLSPLDGRVLLSPIDERILLRPEA